MGDQPSPSPRRAAPGSPRFMQSTASAATRTAGKTNTFAGEGAGPATNAAAREAMREAVQLRSQMRQQRIRERVEEASTNEAAYQDPAEQWQTYLSRCGRWSPGGRGRKASPDRQRLAHQTSQRIFTEQAAAVEEAVKTYVGGGLDTVLDYTATVAASDAAANAVASAALRRASPSRAREPTRDSHGHWVGERIEEQLSGAAGNTSAELGRRKDDNKYEVKRLDFLAKAAKSNAHGATGAGPTGEVDTHAVAAEPLLAKAVGGAAGLTSQSLYRSQREKSGLLDEAGKTAGGRGGASPANSRRPSLGADAPYAWDPDNRKPPAALVDVSDAGDGISDGAKRIVAGLTSSEMYEVQFKRQPKAAARGDDGSKVAGVTSSELALSSSELKMEGSPRLPQRNPDHRSVCEAKAALTDASNTSVSGAGASIDIVSNAPTKFFDGAAGMNSAQMRRARSAAGNERRHVSPMLASAALPSVATFDKGATDDAKYEGPVPKLPLKAAGVVDFSPDKSDVLPAPSAAAMALAARPTTAGEEPFAGQRSSAIQKPTSAWEARHLWSESTKAPKGGFGDRIGAAVAGGAGMTSDQLATYAKELKFEGRSASPRAAPAPPKTDMPSPARFDGAAGLTSSKICEIGPGMVNKYDLPSPGRKGPLLTKADAKAKIAGAAGRTSSEIAENLLAEQSAEARRLSALAARAALARSLSPGMGRPLPAYESTPAFSGAAGVTSAAMGKDLAKKEFVSDETERRQPASRGGSPHRRSNSSGVAAVFGGGDGPTLSVDVTAAGVDAFHRSEANGHGMSSRAVAIQRLVSRHAHTNAGGKSRAASEPRRRPSTGGTDAASLLYGNAFGGDDNCPIGVSMHGTAERGSAAGRTSGDLAMPREERRIERSGNIADNLWGSGGLGGYMGGGLDACRRRDSGGFNQLELRKAAAQAGSPRPQQAPVEGSKPKGWSPARAMPQQRQSFGGGENRESVGSLFGGGGSSAMVTSSSAIGSGWGVNQSVAVAQAGSPVRGLRA